MTKVPYKYIAGLSPKDVRTRIARIKKGSKTNHKDPAAYRPFATDKNKKTRKSKYTAQFERKYPGAKSLEQKAKASGIPLKVIKKVYNRGLAAWRTGHRPGASQQAWGYARVHSFIMKGKTFYTADADLTSSI
jgi:hypothetical protein